MNNLDEKEYWYLKGIKIWAECELMGMGDTLNGHKKKMQGTIFRKRDNVLEVEFEFDKVIIVQDVTFAEVEKYNPDFWINWQVQNIISKF